MRLHDISIAFPWAFLLVLLAPLIVYFAVRSYSHMPRWQRAVSAAWRFLVLLVFAAALSNPSMHSKVSRICVAAVVDLSKSIPRDALPRTSDWLGALEKSRPPGGTLRSFVFAGGIAPAGPGGGRDLASLDTSQLQDTQTNLADAVFHATSLLPQDCDRRIVLITDGRDTQGDRSKIPDALARSSVKIYTMVPEETRLSEVILEDMVVPPVVRTDAAFNARVVVYASEPVEATVRLWDSLEGAEETLVEERQAQLEEGTTTLTFEVKVNEEGKHKLRAEISQAKLKEVFAENNAFEAALLAQGPSKVLYVEGEPSRGGPLRSALTSAGYKVQLEGPSALGLPASALSDFDAIFLSDVAHGKLPGGALSKIKAFAAGGGIFVFAGGKSSYQLGGYRGTPFEPFLPVSMEVEKEVEKVSTAVILVLDKSGSMSGLPVQMAKEAAKASVSVLDPETMVEVISFDSSARRLFHLQKAKNKMMITSFISQIYSGGGTNIYGALQMSLSDMVPVQAKKKHIVLLTDGQSSKEGIDGLLAKASGNAISISTIGLGTAVDRALLEKIAIETGGKSYFTTNPKSLPRLFMQEMRVVAPPSVVEGVLDVKVKKSMPFISKVGGALPYVRGYNLTSPKGGKAMTVLVSDRGDPIMAMAKQGKGWVVAFTSDVKSRWGAPWAGWNLFGKFWAELIRTLAGKEKKDEEKSGEIDVKVEGGKVTVAVDLVDEAAGEFIDGATGSGSVARFNQKEAEGFTLGQTAPGHYEGSFTIDDYGVYFIGTEMKSLLGFSEKAAASLNIPYPPEYRKIGADDDLLKAIAQKSRGTFNPAPKDVWRAEGSDIETSRALWPWIVLLLLLLIPLDILIRRLPF
jgi:Ca-activated chloride channel family protein